MTPASLDIRPFRGGFAVARVRRPAAPEVEAWTVLRSGPWRVYIEPTASWQRSRAWKDRQEVILFGAPLDLSLPPEEQSDIASIALEHLTGTGGTATALSYISRLGGRFAALIIAGDSVLAVPDATASKSIHWGHGRDGVIVASHPSLVAAFAGVDLRDPSEGPSNRNERGSYLGSYPRSGVLTSFAGILPVFANCYLHVMGDHASQRRSYSYASVRLPTSIEDSYELFCERLDRHAALLCSGGPLAIAVDPGIDAQTAFASALPHIDPAVSHTLTCLDADPDAPESLSAVALAARPFRGSGVEHRVLRTRPLEPDSRLARAYAQTLPVGALISDVVQACVDGLSISRLLVPTCIAFGQTVGGGHPRLDALFRALAEPPIDGYPELLSTVEPFSVYWCADESELGPDELADMLAWEYHMTRNGRLYSELDMVVDVVLPFNQREIIEALLSLPPKLRSLKYLQERYVLAHLDAPWRSTAASAAG